MSSGDKDRTIKGEDENKLLTWHSMATTASAVTKGDIFPSNPNLAIFYRNKAFPTSIDEFLKVLPFNPAVEGEVDK